MSARARASPAGPIWVAAGHRVFRIEGGELEEDQQAFGLVKGIDFVEINPGITASGIPMNDIWGTAPDDIWIDSVPHFDGARWRRLPGPDASSPKRFGGKALYGADRTHYLHVNECGWEQWDGAQWNPGEALGQTGPCGWESVHGTSRSDIHLGGAQGRLARFDGTSWRLLAPPVPVNVHALWVKSPVEAYAGGTSAAETTMRPVHLTRRSGAAHAPTDAGGGGGPVTAAVASLAWPARAGHTRVRDKVR
jgi:hypothetical protein